MSDVLDKNEIGTAPPANSPEIDQSRDETWAGHAVNLRITLPLPIMGKHYLVLLAGKEQRSPKRLEAERRRHPIITYGNITVLALTGTVIGLTAFSLLQSAAIIILNQSGAIGSL